MALRCTSNEGNRSSSLELGTSVRPSNVGNGPRSFDQRVGSRAGLSSSVSIEDLPIEILLSDRCLTGRGPGEGSGQMASKGTETPKERFAMETNGMSKTQRKKMAKRAQREAGKADRKARDKARRKEKKQKRAQEAQAAWQEMNEAERAERRRQAAAARETRNREEMDRRKRSEEAFESGTPLVLDLAFGEMMREQERCSLGSQLMFAYASNSRARQPMSLWMTGVEEGGEMDGALKRLCGTDRWLVHKTKQCYVEQFKDRKQDLVYLTADAEEEITQLDDQKIYIIGGIVDRNRHKNVTLDKAKEQGIATARLPVHQHVQLSASAVLTVNQVVDILLAYRELKDWKAALVRAIPERKRTFQEAEETDLERTSTAQAQKSTME